MLTITWLDPRTDDGDEPAWAVWETECGTYRVAWNADSDEYTPCAVEVLRVDRASIHYTHRPVAAPCRTLEDAQDAINQYHCRKHNLALVS